MQTNNVIEEVKDLAAEQKQAIANVKKSVTRATKARRQKELLRKLLQERSYKWNELLDEAVKAYLKKYEGEETDVPDLKGKFGSNFALLEEAGEVAFDKATNTCTLVAAAAQSDEKTKSDKKTKGSAKKIEQKAEAKTENASKAESVEKAPVKESEISLNDETQAKETNKAKRVSPRKKSVKETKETKTEKKSPVDDEREKNRALAPSAPQTADKTANEKSDAAADKPSEKTADVSLSAEQTAPSEKSAPVEKTTPVKETQRSPVSKAAKAKNETSLMDFVYLGNATKKAPEQSKTAEPSRSAAELPKETEQRKFAEKPSVVRADGKENAERSASSVVPVAPTVAISVEPTAAPIASAALDKNDVEAKGKKEPNRVSRTQQNGRENAARVRGEVKRLPVSSSSRQIQTQEQLKEEFLKRLRFLSGEYFEYYSVYLLERYSLKSGRRLEGFRVSGGKNDGGIDGEIELTDRFGFRETIYIQAKNWDPTKGVAEKWTIGETLLQQFVGAVTCRQAKDGKRNSRGIFMTTSHFTKEARELLTLLGEKFIGYDGDDVFETAKECEFGIIKENGVYKIDEKLLSSDKAFFHM